MRKRGTKAIYTHTSVMRAVYADTYICAFLVYGNRFEKYVLLAKLHLPIDFLFFFFKDEIRDDEDIAEDLLYSHMLHEFISLSLALYYTFIFATDADSFLIKMNHHAAQHVSCARANLKVNCIESEL